MHRFIDSISSVAGCDLRGCALIDRLMRWLRFHLSEDDFDRCGELARIVAQKLFDTCQGVDGARKLRRYLGMYKTTKSVSDYCGTVRHYYQENGHSSNGVHDDGIDTTYDREHLSIQDENLRVIYETV